MHLVVQMSLDSGRLSLGSKMLRTHLAQSRGRSSFLYLVLLNSIGVFFLVKNFFHIVTAKGALGCMSNQINTHALICLR